MEIEIGRPVCVSEYVSSKNSLILIRLFSDWIVGAWICMIPDFFRNQRDTSGKLIELEKLDRKQFSYIIRVFVYEIKGIAKKALSFCVGIFCVCGFVCRTFFYTKEDVPNALKRTENTANRSWKLSIRKLVRLVAKSQIKSVKKYKQVIIKIVWHFLSSDLIAFRKKNPFISIRLF